MVRDRGRRRVRLDLGHGPPLPDPRRRRPQEPMLEGWTTLGFIAAHTQRARLGLLVGGVQYRHPACGSRRRPRSTCCPAAVPGSGSGRRGTTRSRSPRVPSRRSASGSRCSRRRSRSPTRCSRASTAPRRRSRAATSGATRLLNSPQSLSRPRVPIMVGGGGERKTLRLVAQYADACNVFGGPEAIPRKYRILEAHCAAVGRAFDEIERTTLQSAGGQSAMAATERSRRHRSWTTSASSATRARST